MQSRKKKYTFMLLKEERIDKIQAQAEFNSRRKYGIEKKCSPYKLHI